MQKRLIIMAAIAASGLAAQAATYDWTGTGIIYSPVGDSSWTNVNSWHRWEGDPASQAPGDGVDGDNVLINRYIAGNEGIPGQGWDSGVAPVINTTIGVDNMWMAGKDEVDGGIPGGQSAQLDLVSGAEFTVNNLQVGAAAGSTSTLNLSGDAAMTINVQLWTPVDGATATFNMNDSSTLSIGALQSLSGWQVVMDADSVLTINSAAGADFAAASLVVAKNAAGGESIKTTDLGDGLFQYELFSALPSPAPVVWIDSENLYWTSTNDVLYSVSNRADLVSDSWVEWTNGIAATPFTNSLPLPVETFDAAFFKVNAYR